MPGKPHILLSHIYFPPSPKPYGRMLEHMARSFAALGYTVSVFSSSEKDAADGRAIDDKLSRDGISVHRVILPAREGPARRLLHALRYSFALANHIIKAKPDIATVGSFPPIFTAFIVAVAGRMVGTKIVYHVQDIHPDITAPKLPALVRPLYTLAGSLMNRLTLRLVRGTVTLSPDMHQILVDRGASKTRSKSINNLSLSSISTNPSVAKTAHERKGRYRVIYAGNMGAYQALDVVADFVRRVAVHADIEFLFVGDGVRREWLREALSGIDSETVRFIDAMPFNELAPLLSDADIGLVSLDRASARYAYPSKIITYLGVGLPLLCLIDPDSAIARDVEDNGLGIAFNSQTIEVAASRLFALAESDETRLRLKENARRYFASNFSEDRYIRSWDAFLSAL